MAKYRKLGRTSKPEKSINQKPGNSTYLTMVRSLQQKLKQKRSARVAEGLIALAVKEKDNLRRSYCKSKSCT